MRLRSNGWLIAVLGAALGGAACRSARLRAPIDLGAYASGVELTQEIATPPPIVRLRVPESWSGDSPKMNPGIIDDGLIYDRDAYELPIPEITFWAPKFEYAGAVYYEGLARKTDIEWIRNHEVPVGFAKSVDDPSLSRTRIAGRDAFIVSGTYDVWKTNLSSRQDPRTGIERGDIVMAIIPLRNLGTNVIVILISRPGVLSRDPSLAFAIFGTCEFREPRRPYDECDPADAGPADPAAPARIVAPGCP